MMTRDAPPHGRSGESEEDREIRVTFVADGDLLTARIEDDARAFDPRAAPEPNIDSVIEQRPIGGLGVHIVRTVMDRVAYERRNGRNHLTVSKAFRDARIRPGERARRGSKSG